jgi:hypothetical protein
MAGALAQRIGGENRATLLLQLIMLGPLVVPLAAAGVRWLRAGGRLFAPRWAYVVTALTLVAGGRPYYPLPLDPHLSRPAGHLGAGLAEVCHFS